jgi:uncharacterized protein with HEPN domain
MLEACLDVIRFSSDRVRDDLSSDRMLVLALVKSIVLIGEAANNVTSLTRVELSSIPWRDIVAMRNRLVHGYYDINLDIVWKTVTQEIPSLTAAIEQALSDQCSTDE